MPILSEENSLLLFIVVFLISVVLIKAGALIAYRFDLLDKPDQRKRHMGSVPLVGGICVYIVIMLTVLMQEKQNNELYYYLVSAGGLVITGALDDKYEISARVRLAMAGIAALIMIYGAGVYVGQLGNLFGLGNITLPMVVAVPFTMLAVAGYINAMNMADGIDGMAASLAIMTVLSLAALLYGESHLFLLPAIALVAALLAFLVYNLQLIKGLHKVFLGDAGSMLLGFTFSWLAIRFSQVDLLADARFSPVTALFILGLPLVDMLSTIARRIKKGQNPFKPDRSHVHHILLHAGFTPRQTLGIIIVIGGLFHAAGIALHFLNAPDWVQLLVFLVVFGLYYKAVIRAFRFSQIIQLFLGTRIPSRQSNDKHPLSDRIA